MDKKLTKKEFLSKLKIDEEFNKKYGRKNITDGKQVLPPCHFGFQLYTEELTIEERSKLWKNDLNPTGDIFTHNNYDENDIPKRKISLKWNQRSVDVGLGLPFNIASYGFLLEMIAQQVNMVPDKLVGDLTNVHIYNNHIDILKR